METYYIIFMGRVQGVGFRYYLQNYAQKLNLKGTVKNLDNGMVEAYVSGDYDKVNLLINTVKCANPYIRIDDYRIKKVPYKEFKDFSVRY